MTPVYEQLWQRLLAWLRQQRVLPEGNFTPAEIARRADEALADERVRRFIFEYYYPRAYGQVDGTWSDEAAEELVTSLEKHGHVAVPSNPTPSPVPAATDPAKIQGRHAEAQGGKLEESPVNRRLTFGLVRRLVEAYYYRRLFGRLTSLMQAAQDESQVENLEKPKRPTASTDPALTRSPLSAPPIIDDKGQRPGKEGNEADDRRMAEETAPFKAQAEPLTEANALAEWGRSAEMGQLRPALFPLYGVTLGKTTVDELARLGTTEIDSSTGKPFKYYEINGIKFWYDCSKVAKVIYITHLEPLPEQWEALGFDWHISYNQWISLLNLLGFSVKINRKPKVLKLQAGYLLHLWVCLVPTSIARYL